MSEKLNDYLTTSDNQFGFKAKHSTDMCIYAVKSVVKYYNHFHSQVYTCFLDKAFDRINHWTLFSRLIARGVPCRPLVRIIMFWYRTQTICVKLGKLCSSHISVSNGVRQGGILSPKVFSVHVNDLSVALSATKMGCVMNDKSVNLVFYADDLCIISASPAGFQKLIDKCYNYSVQNSLTFNPTKSVCVVFKPEKFKLYCPPMVLNAAPLPYVDSVKYLRFMFTPNSK